MIVPAWVYPWLQSLKESLESAGIPPQQAAAIVAGVLATIFTRLATGSR
jgi:pyrroline-5-carboxylate reductase